MLKGSRSVPNGVLKDATAYVERPRKKLSFREPEIMGHYMNLCDDRRKMGKTVLEKEREKERMINFHKKISEEEEDEDELQSQAMRIVRTVGQAFEVCHKLSLNTPSSVDDDQDPLNDVEAVGSERGSESYCDQAKKGDSADPLSCEALPGEDSTSAQDADGVLLTPQPATQRPLRLDMIPPPPSSSKRNSPMNGGETYISPLSEPLKASGDQVPSAGTPLSAHHEIQLLKEQLEQQSQQTQAALAQVHLLRDQLAAETAARLEAQARTHQLLVHNKELLDHITALVTHLQEQERTQKPLPLGQNVTMVPQMSPSAKVFRWFKLAPSQSHPLSRPESGFVDGEKSQKDGDEDCFKGDGGVFDEEGILEGSQSLLESLGTRKRKKLLKLQLGRMTTF